MSEIEVEDSIPLRLGVIALVIVGIIATDIATETASSFWAAAMLVNGRNLELLWAPKP